MPDRIRTGEAALPPTLNALLRRGEGYGWLSGCGVTLTDNTNDIEIQVGSGRVVSGGSFYDVSTTTKTLGDGDSQYARRDLVIVDYSGDVRIVPGDPGETVPADKTGEFVTSPTPPSAAALDGTLIAEVFVPAKATSSADLGPDNIADRRIADSGGLGAVPVVDSRPAREDLVRTRWWRNTNAGQFEAYVADQDKIVAFSTSDVTTFSGSTSRLVESFDEGLGNWNGTLDAFDINTPAVEGTKAAVRDFSGLNTIWSLPGDGLGYYAESGDTIAALLYPGDTGAIALGWAKEDTGDQGYRMRLDFDSDNVDYARADADGSVQTLDTATVNWSLDTWYWFEVDYDGGGTGIHPQQVYSVDTTSDPPTKDTLLGEIASPPKDTTYRGRGYQITARKSGMRIDYLNVVTP